MGCSRHENVRPLAGAVARALRALHLDAGVDRATAIDGWKTAVVDVLGPNTGVLRAVRVDDATLVVVVPDSGWAGEIRLRERDLVAALGLHAPRAGIKRIRCAPQGERRRDER